MTEKKLNTRRWHTIERGWFVCDQDTICQEVDGWYLYRPASPRRGPFKTLKAAKIAAESEEVGNV